MMHALQVSEGEFVIALVGGLLPLSGYTMTKVESIVLDHFEGPSRSWWSREYLRVRCAPCSCSCRMLGLAASRAASSVPPRSPMGLWLRLREVTEGCA